MGFNSGFKGLRAQRLVVCSCIVRYTRIKPP